MNICRILSFTYFAGLLLLCFHTISGEYNIMDVVPSYMYRKFDNVAEEIFPKEIRIKVSLSYISGTLLYSIDKHMNQLIVSLYYSMEPYIDLEFRKKRQYIYLTELCECENCKYEMLEFFIEIKDTLNLQCNGRAVRKYKYNENKELNQAYPIPYSDQNLSPGSPNEAHLWLVNTPHYKDLYPNAAQMLGCIFQVKYKDLPIIFTEITDKIEQKCKKKCVDNICNGGTCHETYNGGAICNCTETFLNGPYCNETHTHKNLRSRDFSLKFTLLKVSWKSWSKKILDLSNKNVQLELKCSRHTLLFDINYYKDFYNIKQSLILRGYVPNKESIVLVTLSEKNVDIKFFNEGIWRLGRLDSKTDLRSETFTNLTLRSEGGMLGLAYKPLSKNLEWRNVEIEKYEQIKNASSTEDNDLDPQDMIQRSVLKSLEDLKEESKKIKDEIETLKKFQVEEFDNIKQTILIILSLAIIYYLGDIYYWIYGLIERRFTKRNMRINRENDIEVSKILVTTSSD